MNQSEKWNILALEDNCHMNNWNRIILVFIKIKGNTIERILLIVLITATGLQELESLVK